MKACHGAVAYSYKQEEGGRAEEPRTSQEKE